MSDKKIKIGYIPSPPGTIKDPKTGEPGGFYVDAIRLIFKQVNIEPEFIETTWGNFVAGLQSGQFDLSIAGTFATVGRASAVEFTKPISYLGYSAVVKTGDSRFKSLSDLNRSDIKIALIQGGASVEYAKENFPKAQLSLLATGNLLAPFVEVSAGRADVGIEDAWQAHRYAKEHPEVTNLFEGHPYNVLPIAWSVKRGNEDLRLFMNTAIDWLMINDRFQKLASAYGETGRYLLKTEYVPLGTAMPKPEEKEPAK
ncbi:ABC transporter substrate-binding protein [Sphingomonas sp.]|uniref:substrate-binding periplasmic protein n=1 Tax=Sphingomonas sp. TaxID=28214 RepID=UPI0025D4BC0D|nr:ABC transporter substrate-binding protein [Sphingomonas sp.]MBV9527839.1 amino acid ABC transporter substrate-binding protein [Sphingomonas sp.]